MSLPDRIATERLRLILVTAADAADMRAGRRQQRWHPSYPRPDDVAAASLAREEPDPWGPRHVVLGGQAVGTIGCFGPPRDGEAEVGFALVPEVRGAGLATEAVRALAEAVGLSGHGLRAAVHPANGASLRVLTKAGFTELRGTTEDGELVVARPVRVAPTDGRRDPPGHETGHGR